MENRSDENTNKTKVAKLDLDSLLHPASAFVHPMDVVKDLDLTLNEKRAVLASWASDACAIEAAPALRATSSGCVVSWDEIMDALCLLDEEVKKQGKALPHYKRVFERKRPNLLVRAETCFRNRNDQGRSLN